MVGDSVLPHWGLCCNQTGIVFRYLLVGESSTATPSPFSSGGNGTCTFLVNPFDIASSAKLHVFVPGIPGLIGAQLYFQRMDWTFAGSQMYVQLSSGVEATAGL